ncbi:MAG: radical SAM protein, partial [Candidatus Omnitrophota bacterium]
CYFCSVKLAWSRKWRSRSAKNVVDEIEFLKNKYGYREFHFVDDNSSVSKKRMIEICDELIKRKLDVKLATPTGIAIATLDKEVLGKMKKAGFYRLCFGLETGNPQSQIIIKKRVNLEKAKEVIKVANSLGFWTSATFILGFPHETMLEFNNTIRFTQETNMDFAIFYLLTPQPGTEVYNILKEQGLIDLDRYIDPKSEDWYKIGITYCNGFKTSLFSNQELQDILAKAYKDFLFYKLRSLSSYMNLVKKIKNWEDFRYMLGLASVPLNMILGMLLGNKLSNVSIRDKDKELSNIEDKI